MVTRMKSTRAYLPADLKEYKKYVMAVTDPKNRDPKSATFDLTNARLFRALFVDGSGLIPEVGEVKNRKEIEALINGHKKYQCKFCYMRNSQNRGAKDHALKCSSRSWMLYKHLRIDEKFICLVCYAGFPLQRLLCMHYLRHSWYDCKTIGVHPFNLAKVFNKLQPADDKQGLVDKPGSARVKQTLE